MPTKTAATKSAPAAKKAVPAKPAPAKSEAVKAERIIKAGGKKGEAVVAALTADVSLSRQALAEKVGCTVGRVGEVIRHLRDRGTAEEKALIERHLSSQTRKAPVATKAPAPAKGAAKTATPTKPAAKPAAKSTSRTAKKTAAIAKDAAQPQA